MPRNTTVVAVCGRLAEDSVTRAALPFDVAIRNSHERVVDGGLVDESLADRVQRLGTELVRHEDVAQWPEAANVTAPNPHAD